MAIPSNNEVRHRYAEFPYVAELEGDKGWASEAADFDAWLTEHDRQVIAAALRELADDAMQRATWPGSTREFVAAYLRTSADVHVTA